MEEAPAAAVEEGSPSQTTPETLRRPRCPLQVCPPWSRRVRPRVTTTTRCRRWKTARSGT